MWPEEYEICDCPKFPYMRQERLCNVRFITRRERILRYLEALADKVNEGWKPDWKKSSERKYFLAYSHDVDQITIGSNRYFKEISDIYFKSREAAERVIAEARIELQELFSI